jgi:tetratricopeptide (TPR) repeat protein
MSKRGVNMKQELHQAISYRGEGRHQESNELLTQLVDQYPDDPYMNYQCAWSYDLLGQERAAVPYYEKAVELGLSGENLEGAFIGLGSTYRALGEYEKSKSVFEKGMTVFPENKVIQVFYAMTLYNLGQYDKTMELLLKNLAETSTDQNIHAYREALLFYADKLDVTWS